MARSYAQPRLVAVYRLLRQGSTARAKAACRRVLREMPEDAAATHLLGLIHQAEGDAATAERCLRTSVELDPASADYRANLGKLLRATGRANEAERTCREALALDPANRTARSNLVHALLDLGQASAAETEAREFTRRYGEEPDTWSLLAMTVDRRGRPNEALALYRKILAAVPDDPAANQALGSLLSRMHVSEEARDALLRAGRSGAAGYEYALDLGRTCLQLYRFDEAEEAFAQAVAARPCAADAQVELARVRYARGDERFARDIEDAATRCTQDPRPGIACANLLLHSGLPDLAEQRLAALIARHGRTPALLSALAATLHEAGRAGQARPLVLEALQASADDPAVIENAVAVLLSCGDPAAAMPHIARQRARAPFDQRWLAYEAVAARLLDPDRYLELYDFDRLIRSYDLETSGGGPPIVELNGALREALRRRHATPTHPFGQTFRSGSRTTRNLLTEPEPAIQAILGAFAAPLEEYRRALGTDAAHPVSARNAGGVRVADAWSVRLRRGGFHVNHCGPAGWISAVYWVAAPAEVEDNLHMPGWVRFGEPRFPVPGANPERFIRPRAGRLVVFPSCMWHGSNALRGDDPCTVIGFDALPRDPASSCNL